jgi:hypothetical protein
MKQETDPLRKVVSRSGHLVGKPTGTTRRCRLEGCGGVNIGVRWPDGKITWPCSKGMTYSKKGRVAYLI